jgi:hypothetical protein
MIKGNRLLLFRYLTNLLIFYIPLTPITILKKNLYGSHIDHFDIMV